MTADHTRAPTTPKQCLVMLIEVSDTEIVLMDGQGTKHSARDGGQLWSEAKKMLHADDAPALSSAPGPTTEQARAAKAQAKASKRREDESGPSQEQVREAFGTLGNTLRKAAEAEYGAPVVSAAATIATHTGKRAGKVLRRGSRKGPSRRVSMMMRKGRGAG